MVSDDIYRQLAKLGKSLRTRTNQFDPARPTRWAPYEVLTPDAGEPFTNDGAWAFIVSLLEAREPIETIVLDKPPGKTGYVIIVDGWSGSKIYIKLQLGSGIVIGRSFHNSNR